MIITLKKILRKNQYGEYRILEYHNSIHKEDYDYFTDDIEDLNGTLKCIIDNYQNFDNYQIVAGSKTKSSEIYILSKKGGVR